MRVGKTRSIAHQATGRDELSQSIDRGHPMVGREGHQFYAMVVEKGGRTKHECIDWLLHKARKHRIDLANGAGVENVNLLAAFSPLRLPSTLSGPISPT